MSRLDDVMTLVAIDSVSRNEAQLASHIETRLRQNPNLDVERIGDNVVARTHGFHRTRLLVAGHIDTVPGDVRAAQMLDDRVIGLGASDMKGSLGVMLELALDTTPRSVEMTWVFYAREEIARAESGLLEIAELRPDLLSADAAVLGEPTGGFVEAGCQGTLRVHIELVGERAHTSRPFTGRNAIHRMGELVHHIARYEPRHVEVDGVTFVEQLQVVGIEGGVAANVVPDRSSCTINHRVAPDRSKDDAVAWLRDYVRGLVEVLDDFDVVDWAPPAAPSLDNAHLQSLVALTGGSARGKVGWTDVATLNQFGVPSTNFGAGDPLLAHKSDEFVTQQELDRFASVLGEWIR